ncbi:MAG: type II toxin-antitoxin system HicA family toxin [Athalassotoga sp.]|uniref:type II toxin-antitoxin system HicA family toxin n=1 Tax=Athalassotoga sp. TaxID=2022597 RepID=UPI003D040735
MSSQLPRISGSEMMGFLKSKGFSVVRTRGSHHVMKNNYGKIVVVPVHLKETLGPGIIMAILRQSEISVKEYIDFFS